MLVRMAVKTFRNDVLFRRCQFALAKFNVYVDVVKLTVFGRKPKL